MNDAQRTRQIEKHKMSKCCVCGRWGAGEQYGEPVGALVIYAQRRGLTLRVPSSNAVHEKCLRQLKTMLKGFKRE